MFGPIVHGVVVVGVKEGVEVLALVHLGGLAWLAVHFEMNLNPKPLGLGRIQTPRGPFGGAHVAEA